VLLAALRDHMTAKRLSQTATAKAVGISVSTLSRGLRTGRLSNEVRACLLRHFPAVEGPVPSEGDLPFVSNPQENIGQILHLLQQADSLLGDIRNRVEGLADVTQAKS
jgi:transcriptional regulator with XRE-family HTH domain